MPFMSVHFCIINIDIGKDDVKDFKMFQAILDRLP
jgi:hypothetical protein